MLVLTAEASDERLQQAALVLGVPVSDHRPTAGRSLPSCRSTTAVCVGTNRTRRGRRCVRLRATAGASTYVTTSKHATGDMARNRRQARLECSEHGQHACSAVDSSGATPPKRRFVPRRTSTSVHAAVGRRAGGRALEGGWGGISFTSLASSTRHFSLRDGSWRLRKAERYNLAAHRAKGAAGATKGVYPSNVASACAKCSLRRPLTATTNKPPWISAGMRRQGTAVATMLAHMCIEASERASVFGLPKRAPT